MWRYFILISIVVLPGCSGDGDEIAVLIHKLNEEVYLNGERGELASLSGEERAIHFLAWYHAAEAATIGSFLAAGPHLSEGTRSKIEEMRRLAEHLSTFYEGLIHDERFTLTPSEKRLRDAWNGRFQGLLDELIARAGVQ